MSAPWWDEPMACLDTETTGVRTEVDRIVQAAWALVGPGGVAETSSWVVNPGVPIPDAAAKIHGITDGRALAEGFEPAGVAATLVERLEKAWAAGVPVVIMNAPFDLTLLDREARRHLGGGLDLSNAIVLDPLAIDRGCVRRRRGSRRDLATLARLYEVRQDGAHDALADCLTAGRVVWRQIRKYPRLRVPLPDLHAWQARTHAEWAANYQNYLRNEKSQPEPGAVIDGSWPYKPLREESP